MKHATMNVAVAIVCVLVLGGCALVVTVPACLAYEQMMGDEVCFASRRAR